MKKNRSCFNIVSTNNAKIAYSKNPNVRTTSFKNLKPEISVFQSSFFWTSFRRLLRLIIKSFKKADTGSEKQNYVSLDHPFQDEFAKMVFVNKNHLG